MALVEIEHFHSREDAYTEAIRNMPAKGCLIHVSLTLTARLHGIRGKYNAFCCS